MKKICQLELLEGNFDEEDLIRIINPVFTFLSSVAAICLLLCSAVSVLGGNLVSQREVVRYVVFYSVGRRLQVANKENFKRAYKNLRQLAIESKYNVGLVVLNKNAKKKSKSKKRHNP